MRRALLAVMLGALLLASTQAAAAAGRQVEVPDPSGDLITSGRYPSDGPGYVDLTSVRLEVDGPDLVVRFEMAEDIPAAAPEFDDLTLELHIDSDGLYGDEHYVRVTSLPDATVEVVHERNRVKKTKKAHSVFTRDKVVHRGAASIDGASVTARVPLKLVGKPDEMRFAAMSWVWGDFGDVVPNGTPRWFRWTYEPPPTGGPGSSDVQVTTALPGEIDGTPLQVTEFFEYAPGDADWDGMVDALVPPDRPDGSFHLAMAVPTDRRAAPDWDVILWAAAVDDVPPDSLVEPALVTFASGGLDGFDTLADLEAVGFMLDTMQVDGRTATILKADPDWGGGGGWVMASPGEETVVVAISLAGAVAVEDVFAALPSTSGAVGVPPSESPAAPEDDTWSATPTDPDPAFVEAGITECLEGDDLFADELRGAPVVQDQRGPDGAALLFVGEEGYADCFVIRLADGGFRRLSAAWGALGSADDLDFGSLPLAFVSEVHIGPTVMHGRATDHVARVEVVTDSGLLVEATVADGWFVAWWPGIDAMKAIRAYGDDGMLLGEFDREALFG